MKSTALALCHTSGAHAFDAPILRGSAEEVRLCFALPRTFSRFPRPHDPRRLSHFCFVYERECLNAQSFCTAADDCCQAGTQAGESSANSLWAAAPFYGNCDNVWDLQTSADEMKDTLYPANTGNWKLQAYNECARDYGVDPVVSDIEEGCLGDDNSQCIDLGETAASIIVYQNVCDKYGATAYHNYLQDCRNVAYGICKGNILNKIQQQCPQNSVPTSELSELMDMCEDQVNSMVPIPMEVPTSRPTKKPIDTGRDDRGECGGGGPYDSGSFCYTARQECCSSQKKYDHWPLFCEYYGFDYPPSGLSQSIIPSTFLRVVDCTMCGTSKCASGDTELEDEDIMDDSEEYVHVADHSNGIVSPH